MHHLSSITAAAALLLFFLISAGCAVETSTMTVQVIASDTRGPLKATVHIDFDFEESLFRSRAYEPEDQYLATDADGLVVAEIENEATGQFIVYAPGYIVSSTEFTTYPSPFPHKSPVTPSLMIHYLIELEKKE